MSTLDTLVSLITTSVADYTEQLKNAQLPLPDLDSTEVPVTRTGLSLEARLKAARAVKVIEAACAQLVATVTDPGNLILTVCFSGHCFMNLKLIMFSEIYSSE